MGLLTPPGPHPRLRLTPAGRCLPAASSPSLTFGRLRCVHVACCMLQLPCGLSAGVLPLDRLQLVADTLPVAVTIPPPPLSLPLSFYLDCRMQKHLTSVLAAVVGFGVAACCVFLCAFLDNFSCVSLPASLCLCVCVCRASVCVAYQNCAANGC